jgi:cobalt-precorrin 5A hydrolase
MIIFAITKNGSALASILAKSYKSADVYLPKEFALPGCKVIKGSLADEVGRIFGKYKAIVFITATGIAVRMIAPYIRDKKTDPAVVVLDEKGEYVISLLSGHIGGANELAKELAKITGGQAVITTASDVQGAIAVDTLAGMLDSAIEDFEAAKKVTATIVNGGKVAAYSYIDIAGRLDGINADIEFYKSHEDALKAKADAAILITPFLLPDIKKRNPVAVLRPRVLVVGMGCNRGTSEEEIERLFVDTLEDAGLSPMSVKMLASVEDKKDEAGLLSFAKKRGLKIKFFTKLRLLKCKTPSGASETVFRNLGVYGVCEPAALLAAGAKMLLVAKKKTKNATIAIAEAVSK